MFIIYETINLVNGKRYRGAHRVRENDKYLGSGLALRDAIRKHGKEAFERKTLEIFDTEEEMYQAESNYVTREWVSNPNTYNACVGGKGGWDGKEPHLIRWTEEARLQHRINMKGKGNHHAKQWKIVNINSNQETFVEDLKLYCSEQGWNYKSLHTRKSRNKPYKGHVIEILSRPSESGSQEKPS